MVNQDPYQRAGSLAALLSWHDQDFVRCAYVTILGRQPDPIGEAHHLERLRQGASRLEILYLLRRSEEGRRHDPGIKGLDRALRRAARQRLPGVGFLFRAFRRNADSDSEAARYRRARLNAITLERNALYHIANKLGALEWRLSEQQQARGSATHASAAGELSSTTPPKQRKTPRRLRHLLPATPLARFFFAERA